MHVPQILIADDDVHICEVLASRCRSLGIAVETASAAMEALRKIEARCPDLVVLDVDMPSGSGMGVCEMMASHDALKKIPVIILTGKKDPDTVRRCHELCAYYVTKCGDVWPRLQPLLAELLELRAAPASAEQAGEEEVASATDPVEAALDEPPSVEGFHGKIDPMDAVFSALGGGDEFLTAEPQQSQASVASDRPWVLCIDDDAEYSRSLQLRLEEHGVEVRRAFAGRAGYRTAFSHPASAIILDYELPDGNGTYVLRRLKENPVTRDIPVVVLTGVRDRCLERQMYGLGAACFMNKPYHWPTLWSELERRLEFEPAAAPA